jgi:hypothetical protein
MQGQLTHAHLGKTALGEQFERLAADLLEALERCLA